MHMIKVGGSFDSAHKLRGYKGKCQYMHGHTWRFEVLLRSECNLDKVGISIDFKLVKQWVKTIEERYDHKDLNTIFVKENPTAEVISKKIFEDLKKIVNSKVSVYKVALWETPNNCIEYMED